MIAAQNAKPEVPPMLILNKDGDLSPLVDLQGKFIDGLGSISGKYVKSQYYNEKDVPEKSVDVEIAIKLIGNQSQQEVEGLEIGLKMQTIGICQDLGIGEFLCRYGALKMVKRY